MNSYVRRALSAGVLVTGLVACDPACPAGLVQGADGRCGAPMGDGALPAHDGCSSSVPETCNAVDDDCNGRVDDGAADEACGATANGSAGCSAGACYTATCNDGYDDCDLEFENGCEAQLDTDISNCGRCGNVCDWACGSQMGCNDAIKLALSSKAKCILRESGHVVCWGDGTDWELGDNLRVVRSTPGAVRDVSNATDLSGGTTSFCAVTSSGTLKCWGSNLPGAGSLPSEIRDLVNVRYVQVSAEPGGLGKAVACAVTRGQDLLCFGDNSHGQIGADPGTIVMTPRSRVPFVETFAVAGDHVCATVMGSVVCWGRGTEGQLGNGMTADSPATGVWPTNFRAHLLAASVGKTCAVNQDGVFCWGTPFGASPRQISMPVTSCQVRALTTSCAACVDGRTLCWDSSGQAREIEGVRDIASLSGSGFAGVTTSGTPIEFDPASGRTTVAPRPAR